MSILQCCPGFLLALKKKLPPMGASSWIGDQGGVHQKCVIFFCKIKQLLTLSLHTNSSGMADQQKQQPQGDAADPQNPQDLAVFVG